jgi:hypothetical protein
LRDGEADRALHVPGGGIVPALEIFIKSLQHAPRLLAGLARTLDSHVVATRVGDHAETPLD